MSEKKNGHSVYEVDFAIAIGKCINFGTHTFFAIFNSISKNEKHMLYLIKMNFHFKTNFSQFDRMRTKKKKKNATKCDLYC